MRFSFRKEINWIKRGILWLLYISVVIIVNIITLVNQSQEAISYYLIMISLTILFTAFGVYKSLFYFNIQEKDYITIDHDQLSIYKGNLLSRKTIPFQKIERVVEISNTLLIKLVNGKEQQIHTEWLTEKDSQTLRRELKTRLGEKFILK
ncbi:hypothetical protein [Gracilibacillus kekensis]|uniref:Uncharacterized protein n=1 Tax=Gracilibacillus kekensis TaxID=1027249 RepID=A0A1M7NSI0_9BACI|nr:hypothetical protein [Gracilibacillus kekensis]SHN07001.1 hypothetical protein SAMN05216179_1737 [Gracilibacillus kekensis]